MSISFYGTGGISQGVNSALVQQSTAFVTNPLTPAVCARRVTGANVWETFVGGSTYVFNSLQVNRGNCYNAVSGLFVCPIAGCYCVTVSGLMGTSNGSASLYVARNGANVSGNGNHVNTNGTNCWYNGHITSIIYCVPNDIISILAGTTGACIYSEFSQLTIEYIG